jgi:hypothetical protein
MQLQKSLPIVTGSFAQGADMRNSRDELVLFCSIRSLFAILDRIDFPGMAQMGNCIWTRIHSTNCLLVFKHARACISTSRTLTPARRLLFALNVFERRITAPGCRPGCLLQIN